MYKFAIGFCCFLSTAVSVSADFKSTGVPRYDAAVRSAVGWLVKNGADAPENQTTFIAYALYKAGEPKTSPLVAKGIEHALHRANETGYSGYDHVYLAGVDAMLLADLDEPDTYRSAIQKMVDHVHGSQRSDGSWSESPTAPGDSSMAQYALLCLWAGDRVGCTVSPNVLEMAAAWHLDRGQPDGGWAYRPGILNGPERGLSQHTTTTAGAGSLAIVRLLFFGPRTLQTKKVDTEKRFGVLEKEEVDDTSLAGSKFPEFKTRFSMATFDSRIARGLGWVSTHFSPTAADVRAKNYFYYALERVAALHGMDDISGSDWFTVYADGLLTHQSADGSFDKTYLGPRVDTAFAILFLMRSTQVTLMKTYGQGLTRGERGNPFGDKEKKPDPTELDLLLSAMEKELGEGLQNVELDSVDEKIANEVVRSVQAITDPEALIGQKDRLKALVEHPDADVRRAVYWALGRTGDFSLIPLMIAGLRDPHVDVNVEAEMALRFISRKPGGLGASLNPKGGAETATPEEQVKIANEWRRKAISLWAKWYSDVRPFEEKDGFDELENAAKTK